MSDPQRERKVQRFGCLIAVAFGVLGLVAAIATLIDGTGAVFPQEGAYTVIPLGWGGAALSLAVVVLAMQAARERSRVSGIYICMAALTGVLVGGTIFMVGALAIAFAGGVLATVSATKDPLPSGAGQTR